MVALKFVICCLDSLFMALAEIPFLSVNPNWPKCDSNSLWKFFFFSIDFHLHILMPTLQMLISALFKLVFPFPPDASGERKKAVAQAFTSWNEHLTYKGVPLHISATGGSETKIHQGAGRHCHWLTRGAAIKWERPSLVWVCQRVFLRLCWELKLVKRMIFKITKEYTLQLVGLDWYWW